MFQPANVNPVFVKGTFGETEDPSFWANFVIAADETAVVGEGTEPPVLVFPS